MDTLADKYQCFLIHLEHVELWIHTYMDAYLVLHVAAQEKVNNCLLIYRIFRSNPLANGAIALVCQAHVCRL